MVKGTFVENTPFINVLIAWNSAVQNEAFILDTGFTGDLQVTEKMAIDLGLTITGVTPVGIANGAVVQTPTALAITAMEGSIELVNILISKGSPLAGIGFLKKYGYRATVCCEHDSVELEKNHSKPKE